MWGASAAANGDRITWGTVCGADCDSIIRGSVAPDNTVWGTTCADVSCTDVVWGSSAGDVAEIVLGRAGAMTRYDRAPHLAASDQYSKAVWGC